MGGRVYIDGSSITNYKDLFITVVVLAFATRWGICKGKGIHSEYITGILTTSQ